MEVLAEELPWHEDRSWSTSTHIWSEHGVPVVDLHDLSVRLGLEVVDSVERLGADLPSGGLVLITGRGRHTAGLSPLRREVEQALRELAARQGVQIRPQGPGRFQVTLDPSKMPAGAYGTPPAIFWLFLAAVTAAVAAIALDALGLLP